MQNKIELMEPFYSQINPSHTLTSKKFSDNAFRARNSSSFVIFDLETTGFSPFTGGYITEIGAVKVENGEIVDVFERFVDPQIVIPKKITALTGINYPMVYKKGRYTRHISDFLEFVGDSTLVAHNSKFDWDTFIKYYAEKTCLYPTNPVIDTLCISRNLYPIPSHKLRDICDYLGIEMTNAHRALDDVKATYKVFMKMLEDKALEESPNKEIFIKEDIDFPKQKILSAKQWIKEFDVEGLKQKHNRIYVNTDYSKLFYDIEAKDWEVVETRVPIDKKDLSRQLGNLLKN